MLGIVLVFVQDGRGCGYCWRRIERCRWRSRTTPNSSRKSSATLDSNCDSRTTDASPAPPQPSNACYYEQRISRRHRRRPHQRPNRRRRLVLLARLGRGEVLVCLDAEIHPIRLQSPPRAAQTLLLLSCHPQLPPRTPTRLSRPRLTRSQLPTLPAALAGPGGTR